VARKKISPAYSTASRAANVTGLVIVSVHIDEQGNVTSAKAVEGPGLLRQAAENAAKQWKFNPARRNGRAVQDTQQVRFMFQRQ
jgi:protein TonB